MDNDLSEKIDQAIMKMADQVKAQPDAQKSLHCSQAALNLAHVKSLFNGLPSGKPGTRKSN